MSTLMASTDRLDIKWETLLRFRFIEIYCLWEGRLTSKHLEAAFGLQRAQAGRVIGSYKERAPGNIIQDPAIKGQRPTESFTPVFSAGTADEYFNLLSSNDIFEDSLKSLPFPSTNTHVLRAPRRLANPDIVRRVVNACRKGLRLEITYGSMSTPEGEERIIAPHSIVSSGYRWHTRAFCEKDKIYKDFLLGRILSISDELGRNINDPKEDEDWHNDITLELIPNPHLSEAQQNLVRYERCFDGPSLKLVTRRATATYLLQMLQIPADESDNYRENPVVLKGCSEIARLKF